MSTLPPSNPSELSLDALKNLVGDCLQEARRQGATGSEVGLSIESGLSVSARLGEVETVEHHRSRGLGLTAYLGQRKGSASTSDLSPKAMKETVEALAAAVPAVLEEAIAAGGSTLRDYVQTDGELGYFQKAFAVYGREGEPCPGCTCQASVERVVQAGRSTFFCASCQK